MAAAAALPPAIPTFPSDIRKDLVNYWTPWMVSDHLFQRLRQPYPDAKYKEAPVLPDDPEWRFPWRLFHHHKPTKYGIDTITFVYSHKRRQGFEAHLSTIEERAPKFSATWPHESQPAQRAKVIARWEESAKVFSPFSTTESDGRAQHWEHVKVIPAWHGTSEAVCQSICNSGFTFFGKKCIPGASGAPPKNTDDGFFGSGIYLTPHASYAGDIYAQGYLMMGWVAMSTPFPVIGNKQQIDMKVLTGQGAYKQHNAHYIPVAPTRPTPFWSIYHPPENLQEAICDEYVVFQEPQVLPFLRVKLAVELPIIPQPIIPQVVKVVKDMIDYLKNKLQNSEVDNSLKLRNVLNRYLSALMRLKLDDDLPETVSKLFTLLEKLLTDTGKVVKVVCDAIIQLEESNPIIAPAHVPQPVVAQVEPEVPLPAIAFGKKLWADHIGDVGDVSLLPANIDEILNSPCPFWPEKTVGDTHLLVWVPKAVNGQPLTVKSFGELVKRPLRGLPVQYKYINLGHYQDEPTESHWMLFTRFRIEETCNKPLAVQKTILQAHSQKVGRVYTIPNILGAIVGIVTEFLRNGIYLYGNDPTRCQEEYDPRWRLSVGDFGVDGLTIDSDCGDDSNGVGAMCKL